MNKVIEMRRQRADLLDQARKLADGELTTETRAQADNLIAQADQMEKDIQREERLQEMLTAKLAPKHNKIGLGDNEERAFAHWLRTGDGGGLQQEQRASNATDMNIGTAADGQYLGVIARRDEMALTPRIGVRSFVGKGTSIYVPVDNEADGEFVVTTEANEFDLDAPATDRVTLTKLMYTKQVKISYQLLQDEDSNLLEFLTDFVGRGLAKTHNSLLITEALANGTASLTLDGASAITAAEIPELVYKQAGEYAEGSVWIMKRATEGYIRGLASSSIFLFNPNPAGDDRSGQPEIWGFPVYNTEKMAAIGGTYKSLLFGNFAYMGMYEDPGMTMVRDPYSLAYTGQVRLLYHFRVDYGVLQAEAIHYATHPSA